MTSTKTQATVQHVTHRPDGLWEVRREGNLRATRVTETQKEAWELAVQIAREKGGEVVVHGLDGRVRSRDIYAADPRAKG